AARDVRRGGSTRDVCCSWLTVARLWRCVAMKLLPPDNFLRSLRYEITDGTAGRNPVSNVSRGDVDVALNNGINLLRKVAATAVEHDELHKLFEFINAVPFV